jgi:hypothetical protein
MFQLADYHIDLPGNFSELWRLIKYNLPKEKKNEKPKETIFNKIITLKKIVVH